MHLPSVKHTLAIFEQLYDALPPLVPPEIKSDMKSAMEQVKHNYSLTLDELEDTMIVFGKKIWPYRQAFREFEEICEGKLGEHFLRQKISFGLKKRYEEFMAHGGDFRDLRAGGPLGFFTPEERVELCEGLVAVHAEARKHAVQSVASTERASYEDRVEEFFEVLNDIESRLLGLRETADDEQEHPELAEEIRSQIRAFEYGLCALGPHTSHDAVCEAAGFFAERKLEKKHQRVT